MTDALARAVASLAETAQFLWDKGWAERNGGNISVNVTDAIPAPPGDLSEYQFLKASLPYPELSGCALLVTGAGTRMREVAKDPAVNCCVLRIAEQRNGYHILWGGKRTGFLPTSELASHLTIHAFLRANDRPEKALLHTHPDELIALTHIPDSSTTASINQLLWRMHPEVKIFLPEGINLVPYRPPGSEALAQATVAALSQHRAAVWEKHGCVAIGRDPLEAFDLVDMLNKAARIFFLCKGAGLEPQGLSREQVEELGRLFPC